VNLITLLALGDELLKIAEAPAAETALENAVGSVDELRKKMRAGDIILSTPHLDRLNPFMRHVFKPASRFFQGTTFGHAAMYAGRGKVIDTRDKGKKAVHETTLDRLSRDHDLIVLDPNITDDSRREAVKYMKDNIGRKFFSKRKLVQTITPFTGHREPGASPEEPANHEIICSSMVANAYPRKFFSKRSRIFTRPGDILRSSNVRPVSALISSGTDYRTKKAS
jgi:hypothetical protein